MIPQFTLNSALSGRCVTISCKSTFTGYGRQKPKRFNYKGEAVSGSELNEVSPYSIVGLSSTGR